MIARGIIALLLAACAPVAGAQDSARIVYLGVEDDPLYQAQPVYTGLSLRDVERPRAGLEVAMRGTRVLGRALGLSFELTDVMLPPEGDAGAAIAAAWADGAVAVVLDLPSDMLAQARGEIATGPGAHFNIRQRDTELRGILCTANLFHTAPSEAMLQDALAQLLRARGWDRILLLTGPSEADGMLADTVRASAAKFGLTIADNRIFELSNDPRSRDRNNIALLTGGGVRHDVIWLIDTYGDFGRYVPYATYAARPVVGTEGLTPEAWHWTFERYGAPQLNQRFRRLTGRSMRGPDWSAWVAGRAVVEAVQRVGRPDPGAIRDHLSSEAFRLDLYKGAPGSFRPWNGQLRQPVLLTTHNAVIEVAPLDGFEHQTDRLDSLGIDAAESRCAR